MSTNKPSDEEFPGFDDDDEGGGSTNSVSRSRGARTLSDATSSALQAMLARAPTAAPTSASIPELPEVTAPDLEEIEVVVSATEPVTADELAAAFTALRRAHATARDRPEGEEIAAGDEVLVDIIGYAGGHIIPFSVRNGLWVDAVPDPSLPGLFEGLVGAPVGEAITVDVDLPDDYPVAALQGAAATFAMTIYAARSLELPAETDKAFFEKTGLGKTLAEVMAGLREAIEEQNEEDREEEAREEVIDQIAARTRVEVPNSLIDEEIRRRWLELEGKTLATLGHEFDDQEAALKAWQSDERTRVLVIRDLRLALGLGAIAKRDGVEVTKEAVDTFLLTLAEGSGIPMSQLADVVQRDKATQRQFSDKLLHIITLEYVMSQVSITFE